MLVSPKLLKSRDPVYNVLKSIEGNGKNDYIYGLGLFMLTHWNPEFIIDRSTFYSKFDQSVELNPWNISWVRRWIRDAEREDNIDLTSDSYQMRLYNKTKDLDLLRMHRNYKKPIRTYKDHYCDVPEKLFLESYGVCDYPEQLLEVYNFENDERKIFICFVEIKREDQLSSGGWRYRKWGAYIGTQNPQDEYLYWDKHIDKVYTFHIYEMK